MTKVTPCCCCCCCSCGAAASTWRLRSLRIVGGDGSATAGPAAAAAAAAGGFTSGRGGGRELIGGGEGGPAAAGGEALSMATGARLFAGLVISGRTATTAALLFFPSSVRLVAAVWIVLIDPRTLTAVFNFQRRNGRSLHVSHSVLDWGKI